MKHLQEMAKVAVVAELANRQENEKDGILAVLPSFNQAGKDLMQIVPNTLKKFKVSLDKAIDTLVPSMQELVNRVDASFNGKVTMAEIASEFGSNVWTTLSLQSLMLGVALSDDPEIHEFLQSKGVSEPEVETSESVVQDAADIVEEELVKVLN